MDLELDEERRNILQMVKDLAKNEISPKAAHYDRTEEFPEDNIKKMAKLGLMGILIPKEYGGAGLDSITYALIIEEISKACASTGAIASVHNSLAPYIIYKFGTEEQKQKYIPPMAKGEVLGAFAATEPNAGTDLGSMKATAVLEGDNYIINGSKTFITAGPRSGTAIVFALTDSQAGHRGMSAFIAESSYEGWEVGSVFEKMGIRASETSELFFNDMPVPKENLLGTEGGGFKLALTSIDGGRIGISAQAVGIAQSAIEHSISYAKERVQFGKPIGKLQAIQWMLADMATRIEASRLLTIKAASLKDKGERYGKEAAMAKLYSSETAVFCANRAVQVHGGYGYMRDKAIERLYRDAKITEIYEGTSEAQKLVIASHVLR